jgi:GR25 family glycosyltransferase involved in LPS biosynthesis
MLRRWDNFSWTDVLHLDYEGSAKRRFYVSQRTDLVVKDTFGPVTENSVFNMKYVAFDQPWTASMACAYAYAIQPDAAQRLIENARVEGWYAVDRFMYEPNVNIDTIHPKVAEEQPEAMHIWTTSEN